MHIGFLTVWGIPACSNRPKVSPHNYTYTELSGLKIAQKYGWWKNQPYF